MTGTESSGMWHECIVDHDYEINDTTLELRRKGTTKTLRYTHDKFSDYMVVGLNGKIYKVHRIVALQFIPNDSPATKKVVDHINRVRTDYRIENLRWVTTAENNMNTNERTRITKKQLHDFVWWHIGKLRSEERDKWLDYSTYRIQRLYEQETGNKLSYQTIHNNREGWYTYHGKLVHA